MNNTSVFGTWVGVGFVQDVNSGAKSSRANGSHNRHVKAGTPGFGVKVRWRISSCQSGAVARRKAYGLRGMLFALICVVLTAPAHGNELPFQRRATVRESLSYLPPNIRSYYLEKAGYDMWPAARPHPESLQLSLIGKWGAGPSVRVTGRDTILFLARGSEVAVVDFADTANLRVLSYIQAPGLVARAIPVGNRLYISSGYIETFDVSNPANPVKIGSVLARAPAIDIIDTLVYTLYRDSFKVFSFADPANPRLLGACRDSGYDLSVCSGYAYIAHDYGLFVLDVRDPSNPHRIASLGFGTLSVRARGNICCATVYNGQNSEVDFKILDVRNPASPVPLATIDSCGGYDIYLKDTFAFLSGYYVAGHGFRILDISDSTHPTTVGSCATADVGDGVWANPPRGLAFVADDLGGLVTVDIANMHAPFVRSVMLRAGYTYNVAVQGQYAYVAQEGLGLKVLDVSDPSNPHEVGTVDSTRDVIAQAVAVRDSFAFIGWMLHPWLRVVDVSDPQNPRKVAACDLFNPADDMVWRDSFLYVAEYYRLQVVNVARPRQPVLVGSCSTSDLTGAGLCLRGNTAYVAGPFDGIHVVDVTDPQNPSPVTVLGGVNTWGCFVRDSLLFASEFDDSLHIFNVANLFNVHQLGAVYVSGAGSDVKVLGNYAFVGAKGLGLVDVSDPRNPSLIAYYTTPDNVMRVVCDSPYVYAACYGGGVCIFDTVTPAVHEDHQVPPRPDEVSLESSPVRERATVRVRNLAGKEVKCNAYTVAGMRVPVTVSVSVGDRWTTLRLDLRSVASGVYLLRINVGKAAHSLRIVKL
jgi:hypothetical protein